MINTLSEELKEKLDITVCFAIIGAELMLMATTYPYRRMRFFLTGKDWHTRGYLF
jgi:hypothetical protein